MKHLLITLLSFSLLGGCGFQLRGESQLPFTAAYVDAPSGSALGELLRQTLSSENKLARQRDGAPVLVKISPEARTKSILSLSGSGKVSEFRLEYRVEVSAFAANGAELAAPMAIYQTRDFTNDDNHVLAKTSEEATDDLVMAQDTLRQVLRRLSSIRPPQ